MEGLTVSQVAKAAGINVETIRYYEKRGLLPQSSRNTSGYRIFTSDTVDDIRLIKRAQDIGFTLEEIKRLLSIYRSDEYFPIEEMYLFAKDKIYQIEEKMNQLNRFKSILEMVVNRPNRDTIPTKNECVIIQHLAEGGMKNG
ncbi:Hg(II)-responsive transcriptional regulator [Paenibacillus sp. CCS19]|uniref:MerR family transcriptional regulator n=1 Tax=Paenibacillus sp. CCS19 TaxID=3158387 RepID=UPI0025687C96|nr:MerR family transcriptional regulator [Paenibacillus cellulosilyticus]GMK41439.1 Hg(II)-responsive transcriptional regulator [Paenibacillus cellulosilyticus]